MSVTSIEDSLQEESTPISLEDQAFANVFEPDAQYTEITAKRLFEAGVNFVRDAEKVDVYINSSGMARPLITNPMIIPQWMFRDAMMMYLKTLAEKFADKHLNGDMNTATYLECVKSIESVMDKSIPVDSSKDVFRAELHTVKRKCEVILNDTI